MSRMPRGRVRSAIAVLAMALAVAACSDGSRNKNAVDNLLTGSSRAADEGLALGADPGRIVIDPDDPATPTDPGHGNERYGETALTVVAMDPGGAPQPDLDITFGATAGALASGGAPVKTDADGVARDTLRVFESDPDSIEVSATDGSRVATIVVEKIVAQPPIADAGPDQVVECTGSSQATVTLDGSASIDPNGDITLHEWFEFFGAPGQTLLGSDEVLDVVLGVGAHAITLRITDATGKSSTDEVIVQVVDTTPPEVEVAVTPSVLWPPNHKMVDIRAEVTVFDCGPYTVSLESVTSNEPDDGLGDGDTAPDVEGAETGAPDQDFALRAERAGGGGGRVYTVVYKVVDAVGLETLASAQVVVPHDQGGR